MQDHFTMFAAYNGWANRKIYAAAADLSEKDYNRDCGAFFKSVNGTLNHILVADMIWLQRFTGDGQAPDRLDVILHDKFDELLDARRSTDDRIVAFCEGLTGDDLGGSFTYTPITDPRPVTQELAPALAHFFNHQTHHRGQIHALLTRLAGEAPSIDLIYFQRETGNLIS